jgi:hypothetical protein
MEGFGAREDVMKRYVRTAAARPVQGNVVAMSPGHGAEAPSQGA